MDEWFTGYKVVYGEGMSSNKCALKYHYLTICQCIKFEEGPRTGRCYERVHPVGMSSFITYININAFIDGIFGEKHDLTEKEDEKTNEIRGCSNQ